MMKEQKVGVFLSMSSLWQNHNGVNPFLLCAGVNSHMDDEYKWAGVEDPKVMVTTSRDPSSRLKMFAKVSFTSINHLGGLWVTSRGAPIHWLSIGISWYARYLTPSVAFFEKGQIIDLHQAQNTEIVKTTKIGLRTVQHILNKANKVSLKYFNDVVKRHMW